ncbi:methyl-accepting chemotaxis protein [Reinekea sp.]|jgi:methyl-accepting chemotaxis protein|uniref:methyl-accepting chemotaxis protein n=1 Tax=Reinekea sp. TaxID=1970455 RepID=UPI002A81A47E|nr:methyl-accepting chemotaxis protein [Reinekea sp.]
MIKVLLFDEKVIALADKLGFLVVVLMNIKFNHLLVISVVLVVFGYLLQAYYSRVAVNSTIGNYQRILTTQAFQESIRGIEKDLLLLEQGFSNVSPDNIDNLKKNLNETSEKLSNIDKPEYVDSQLLSQTIQRGADYQQVLVQRLQLLESIGGVGTPGQFSDVAIYEKAFEEVRVYQFSMFKEGRNELLSAQNNFLITPSALNAENLSDAFISFRAEIEDFGIEGEDYVGFADFENYSNVLTQSYQDLDSFVVEGQAHYRLLSQQLNGLLQQLTKYTQVMQQKSENATSKTLAFLLILTLGICVSIVLIMWRVIFNIVTALGKAQRELSFLEGGDLSRRQKYNSKRHDAIDKVAQSMDQMAVNLSSVISNVQGASQEFNGIVKVVNSLIDNASGTNQENMSKTTSLATATEQISVTMHGISENTRSVNDGSALAAGESRNGTKLVSDLAQNVDSTMSAMDNIKASIHELTEKAKQIDSVIEIINNLAKQTNLLALNAAIEAARAGEAGRGFTVVADEVRSLAESTVSATAQITETIRAFQSETEQANLAVVQGENELNSMQKGSNDALAGIQNIEQLITRNSNATAEMSSAVDEIAKTIASMSTDTDTIAKSLAENSDSFDLLVNHSHAIQEKSEYLHELTRSFKTA